MSIGEWNNLLKDENTHKNYLSKTKNDKNSIIFSFSCKNILKYGKMALSLQSNLIGIL
jgi:hypothetical protein